LADFIIKLPLAQGYNSILVVVDQLTKMMYFILTIEKTLVEGERDRVPRNSNRTKGSRNTERKGRRDPKLANTKERKGDTKVSGTYQLLQAIH